MPCGDLNPSATAWLSVRTTSDAASELGMRPASSMGTLLEEADGGSETSSPVGAWAAALPATGATPLELKVPVIPTWPQADRTCGIFARVASVAPSKAG